MLSEVISLRGLSVFDAHCDTIFRCLKTGQGLASNQGMISLDRIPDKFRRYCQFFALFSNCARPDHPTYEELLSCFRKELARNASGIAQCRCGEEAASANREGKIAAFLTVEGGELLDCDPDRLEQAAEDGVVAINLTWNHPNLLSGSCREEADRGLSDVGRRFVQKMDALRILPDVSHLSDAGFWDVTEVTCGPIIASHSNARAIHHHPRNLTDEQITAIIKSGGVIGLNFYKEFVGLGQNFDAVYAHLDHILSLGGASCAALGGDWDGCDTIDALPSIEYLGDFFEYLLRRNCREEILEDVFFHNLMRVVNVHELCKHPK